MKGVKMVQFEKVIKSEKGGDNVTFFKLFSKFMN